MKTKKEAAYLAGLAAVFTALLLSLTFIAVAIRKKSIVSALLAVTAAAGGTVGAGLLLDKLFAPDGEGAHVTVPQKTFEDAPELFEGEALAEAAAQLRRLGG